MSETTKNKSEQLVAENATVDTQGMIGVLAGKTSECPCVSGFLCEACERSEENCLPSPWCGRCKGTGQVATFQSLGRDCGICNSVQSVYQSHNDAYDNHLSDCPGWLPVPLAEVDLNALLAEVMKVAGSVDLHGDGKGWWLVLNGHPFTVIYYATPAEAVISAIYQAVQE